MEIQKFNRQEDFENSIQKYFENIFEASESKNLNIALAGGSLKKVYAYLAKTFPKEFLDTTFWEVDERDVPKDSEFSNYKLIQENLLEKLGDKYLGFHFFDTSSKDPIAEYQSKLASIQNFDLSILGVGPDGHIASLFPNIPELDAQTVSVIRTETDRFDVKSRLTITIPIILSSKKILILLQGKEKAELVEKIQDLAIEAKDFPARALVNHPELTIMFLNNN